MIFILLKNIKFLILSNIIKNNTKQISKKKLIIYTTSNNKKSIKAISKSGFTFSYELKK